MSNQHQYTAEEIERLLKGIDQIGPLKIGRTAGSHRCFVTVDGPKGLEANCGVEGERNNAKAEFFQAASAIIRQLQAQVKELERKARAEPTERDTGDAENLIEAWENSYAQGFNQSICDRKQHDALVRCIARALADREREVRREEQARIAANILKVRDALVRADIEDAYHWLYKVADHDCESFTPWAALERAAAGQPEPWCGRSNCSLDDPHRINADGCANRPPQKDVKESE